MEKSIVYFTKDISSKSLIKIYEALNRDLKSKVAVKISTGEPGGHNFLNPKLIEPLVSKLNGTIVECCTAYHGRRYEVSEHWKAIKEHGFLDIAPCDIMDEEGEIKIPLEGGKTFVVNRMLDRNAIHIVEEAHHLGLGSRDYKIVSID